MYADDTVVYTAISKTPTSQEINKYQEEINALAEWCNRNKLSKNTDKTKIMILGTNRRSKKPNIPNELTINNNPIELVHKYKYLGLTLNSQLTFSDHMNSCIGLASSKLKTLAFLKNYIDHSLLLRIYKTSILPLLEYANIINPLIPNHLLIKKQRLQNRALRIIYSHLPNMSKEELHQKAKLATLKQRADK